ncbi:MAG TPA: crotonyl-CoA carboxylase/reductase, partial [Candidatus Nanopelagicales bacterium]|nr:crotonyl-CoA carboxylase/reductase [Candidatus Nanopelagicales bacterium]
VAKGMIHPTLSKVLPLTEAGQAAWEVHQNMHQGKVGVLCLAPAEGMGVTDHAFREKVADRVHLFRESG